MFVCLFVCLFVVVFDDAVVVVVGLVGLLLHAPVK